MTSSLMTEPDYVIRCSGQATGWTNEEVDFNTPAETASGVHPGCRWLFPQGDRSVKLMIYLCLGPKLRIPSYCGTSFSADPT